MVTRDVWRGRRVFLTGHTGFKGAWMLAVLRELGADVTGYALPPLTDPAMFDLLSLADACDHVEGDVRDPAAVEAAMAAANPEVVLHMAAQPLVRESYRTPVETYAINVMGTVHVMEACRRLTDVRAVVVVTTDKCYQNHGWPWGYRENDRLGGFDPYSNSKAAAEMAVEGYRSSFFAPERFDVHRTGLASARAGNVIGGGDFAADRLVPDAVRAFARAEPLMIRNPLAVRPWQHVLEPVTGYLRLAERLLDDRAAATGWNFGPRTDESEPVGVVADRLAALWGDGAAWTQDPSEHPHEAATLKLDSTKAAVELGWHPRLSLDAALAMTVDWYRLHAAGGDVGALTRRQVAAFLD